MSNKDFNNGLVLGLSLKGLPYGIHADYKPDISNNDTFSIIIDFKIPIDDLPENYNHRSLWFYGQQEILEELNHMEITPISWERINDSTIKFNFEDFKDLIPPMTILGTNYDGLDYGSINMPYFKVEYEPYGVPFRYKFSEIVYSSMNLNTIIGGDISDEVSAGILVLIVNGHYEHILGEGLNSISMGNITDTLTQVQLVEV